MLKRPEQTTVTAWLLGIASFAVYVGMYFIRKPITALDYQSDEISGLSYKVAVIVAQILGYTLSKFIGIRTVSATTVERRTVMIVILAASAMGFLLVFALSSPAVGLIAMFLNGMSLGLIWGLLFAFVEGRNATDLIGVFLSTSFILASGAAKSVTVFLTTVINVSNAWAPLFASFCAIPLIGFGLWLLNRLPPPTEDEKRSRSVRRAMSREDRGMMFRVMFWSLIPLTLLYVVLTVYRDIRDSFMVDIFHELRLPAEPALFARLEIAVTLIVLVILFFVARIRRHRNAVRTQLLLLLSSAILVGVSTVLFYKNSISPEVWMILTGVSTYIAYIPFNSMLFERLIALYRLEGTVGFLMYFADSFGYLASCTLYVGASIFETSIDWTGLFLRTGQTYVIAAPILLIVAVFGLGRSLLGTDLQTVKQ
jgi:MFS family permease